MTAKAQVLCRGGRAALQGRVKELRKDFSMRRRPARSKAERTVEERPFRAA